MKTGEEKITQYTLQEMRRGLECAYIDSTAIADSALKPAFLSNLPKEGKKVISEVEDLLLSCESYFLCVAFITLDGITPLLETLKELDDKGIKGRVLTTNYLSFSDPKALDRLESLSSVEVRMFDSRHSPGFHTKGYIFKRDGIYRIIIGSANLTLKALTVNREWNTEIVSTKNGEMTEAIMHEAEELWRDVNTHSYTSIRDEYRLEYEIRRKQREVALEEKPVSLEKYTLTPNIMQLGFITNLKRIIENGENRALLISATGTGKTYASAFAMREFDYKHVLFLVHRTQLAKQTMNSYEKVLGSSRSYGILGAGGKDKESDYIFGLVQTLSQESVLSSFSPDHFDCIILDEAHHSAASSYKKILEYFKPKLWLGMTATPDKRDDNIEGRNIYEIFNYQIAYEIRLKEAMEEDLLCPFHYFGLTDIALVGDKRKMEASDFRRLVSDERVDRIIEKAEYFGYSGERVKGLIFCSSIRESEELSEKFNARGYRTLALNGNSNADERARAFERLGGDDGKDALDYILSVEILNEGVDIVEVNQVIMLRPTQSPIVFIQQLGRGLRKARGKDYVVVLDFIGNYENNFMIPVALSGDRSYNRDTITKYVISGNSTIPGCSTIHFDRIAKERIFESINKLSGIKRIIRESYITLKTKLGRRPYLMDFYTQNEVDPLLIIREYRSYQSFIEKVDPDISVPLSSSQILVLEYLSKTVLSGVRPYELEIISMLLTTPGLSYSDIRKRIEKDYSIPSDDETIMDAVNVLEGGFYTNEDDKRKYSIVNIIKESGHTIEPGGLYKEIQKNEEYRKQFEDIIAVGKARYKERYYNPESRFVLYEKYSRRDISLLSNTGRDKSSTMYGMYRIGDDCFIFVTYHKGLTDDESKAYLDGKPDYSDRFEDSSIFLWDSQIGKGPGSTYMHDVTDSIRRHLLVKKSDAESSFYYMGLFDIISAKGDTKRDNNGVMRDITKCRFRMHNSVREDLLRYLESPIEKEEGNIQ